MELQAATTNKQTYDVLQLSDRVWHHTYAWPNVVLGTTVWTRTGKRCTLDDTLMPWRTTRSNCFCGDRYHHGRKWAETNLTLTGIKLQLAFVFEQLNFVFPEIRGVSLHHQTTDRNSQSLSFISQMCSLAKKQELNRQSVSQILMAGADVRCSWRLTRPGTPN